jgi:3-hydroxyacyl-CoA dehydrogenase
MKANDIKVAASICAGVIGYSYALKFAMAGLEVWAQNRTPESSSLARQRVQASLDSLVRNSVYTEGQAQEIASRIHYTNSVAEAVKNAQFIQESSAEHYEVKWEIVEQIEACSRPRRNRRKLHLWSPRDRDRKERQAPRALLRRAPL